MQAVVEGRLDPASRAFQVHIDRCLGCRACEPVCPSGVEYGTLLEIARDTAARHAPPPLAARVLLAVFGSAALRGAFFLGGRFLRVGGLAALGARLMPRVGPLRGAALGLAMLASTRPWRPPPAEPTADGQAGPPRRGLRVGLLAGCVQQGLFSRINEATVRVLEANGYDVVPVAGQDCCGALHAHGGDLAVARDMARRNVTAFESAGVDVIAVNAAGCGAVMKEYRTLLVEGGDEAPAVAAIAGRVRDVSELLVEAGPRDGAPLPMTVAFDHPCHLLHAQGIEEEPLRLLGAIPSLDVRVVERADECCGGAGIYGITHADLGGRIGRDKVRCVRAAGADVVATPNPGCMMQIGGGLRLEGSAEAVAHPIELLDESYRRAGYYAP